MPMQQEILEAPPVSSRQLLDGAGQFEIIGQIEKTEVFAAPAGSVRRGSRPRASRVFSVPPRARRAFRHYGAMQLL
jgi:hypothetical protein